MKSVRLSAARCLAIVFSFILTINATLAQEKYIIGTGVVVDSHGNIDTGKSIEEARRDLYRKVLEVTGKQLSTHTTLKNANGKDDYKTVTAVDSGVSIRDEDIRYLQKDGVIIAFVEKSKIFQQEVRWVEQNITINNSYAPVHGMTIFGTPTTTRTTRHDRVQNVIGPSGNVVKRTNGRTTHTIETRAWNGRYGWSYTREK